MSLTIAASCVLLLFTTVLPASSSEIWKVMNCPDRCECKHTYSSYFQALMRTVDCSGAALLTFPQTLPEDTQVLLLRDNRIRYLPSSPVWLPDLLHMDLSYNHIAQLKSHNMHDFPFDGMYNLRTLELRQNHLTTLRNGIFRGLFNLEELDLADNRITGIADDAFRGLLKLEVLKLGGNRLTYVQKQWWSNVNSLSVLELDRNFLSLLTADNFRSLTSLISLDLSRNKLFRINENAFHTLDKLEVLHLSSNSLTVVPSEALKGYRNLKSIKLGQNPIFKVMTDDFANLPQLKDVNMNAMQRLRLVERGAFKNLPDLLVVEMHDNPYLSYIDGLAFVNTPQVSHLFLHNNNLTTLEEDVIKAMPALVEVSFYGNPLACDCTTRWLSKLLTNATNPTSPIFQEAERMVCDSPAQHRFKLFTSLRPEQLSKACPPRILYMFDTYNARKVGDDITYDCRAIGMPRPRITWVSPDGAAISPSSYHPRRTLINGNTLVIRNAKLEDAGTYTCIAENAVGHAVAQTSLNVSDIQVHIFPVHVSSTSATVTWNGTDRDNSIFQILYRPREPRSKNQYAGTVTPVMNSFTIQNLQPDTDYDICMAFEDSDNIVVHLSCTRLTTMSLESMFQGLERTSNVAVGIALGVVACMMIFLCLIAVGCKRSHRLGVKKPYFGSHCYNDYLIQVDNGSFVSSVDNLTAALKWPDNIYNQMVHNFVNDAKVVPV